MSENIEERNTEWLGQKIKEIKDEPAMQQFIRRNKDAITHKEGADYLLMCIGQHGITEKVLRKTLNETIVGGKPLISRTYFAHYMGLTKTLNRNKLIILAIFAGLSTTELNTFLKYNGEAPLYKKDTRDSLLEFVFNRRAEFNSNLKMYEETEELLKSQNMDPLCSNLDGPEVEKVAQRDYLPTEPETTYLGGQFNQVKSMTDLTEYVEANNGYVISSEESRRYRVSSYILECCKTKGITGSELVSRIKRDYYLESEEVYHLLNINRTSNTISTFTRNNLIAFCVFAEMNVEQVNQALKYNGNSGLYSRDMRDFYLRFFIENKYDYIKIEEALAAQEFEPLNKNWAK